MQYNIFQNDFYESRPGIPWAYRLTVEYGPFAERMVVIQKAIKEANLPEMEQKFIQVHFGGADKYVPTRYQNFGTFSLTFNENCNLSAYKSILGLFRRSLDNREDIGIPGENQPTRHYKYSNLYGELKFIVEILDPKNINLQDTKVTREQFGLESEQNDLRVVAKYEFGDCFIDHIDDLDLDYGSEEIVEWGMTVAYNSISVSYPGQKSLRLGLEDEFRETAFTAYDNYEGYSRKSGSAGGGNGLWDIVGKGQGAFKEYSDQRVRDREATKRFGTEGGKVDGQGQPQPEPKPKDENNEETADNTSTTYSDSAIKTADKIAVLIDKQKSYEEEYNEAVKAKASGTKIVELRAKKKEIDVDLTTAFTGATDEEILEILEILAERGIYLGVYNPELTGTVDYSGQ
jgi:hypothetical protein